MSLTLCHCVHMPTGDSVDVCTRMPVGHRAVVRILMYVMRTKHNEMNLTLSCSALSM